MGYLQASEMARLADLDTALSWHLQHNHYPPVPLSMIKSCKAAIDAYRDEDYQRSVKLPKGVSWRGQSSAPAREIVDAHHLQAFITTEDE